MVGGIGRASNCSHLFDPPPIPTITSTPPNVLKEMGDLRDVKELQHLNEWKAQTVPSIPWKPWNLPRSKAMTELKGVQGSRYSFNSTP